jgi:anaerobic magnesium-protoporphyrin IX monomethyl ester cyclase
MNILFLTFLAPQRHVWGFPFGPAHLISFLKRHGHKAAHEIGPGISADDAARKVRQSGADLICVSSTTDPMPSVRDVVPKLRRLADVPIILGGVHATAAPEDAIQISGLDGICVGEGELALLEYVDRLEAGKNAGDVMNFWLKNGGKIVRNPVRPLIQDLDGLPFPDREEFDYAGFLELTPFGLEFSSSRGCPLSCSFCVNETLRGIYGPEGYVRRRSVGNLMDEVKSVAGKHAKISHVTFHDDVFTMDAAWLADFSRRYSDEVGLPFRVNSNAGFFSRKIASLLREAGCVEVAFGVETGDECLREKTLCKRLSNAQLSAAFAAARDFGIKTRAFNMLGIPGETEDTLKATLRLNRELKADYVNAPFFRPYPGTRLYDMCVREGFLRGGVSDFLEETMLKLPTVSDRRLYFYKRAFNFMHKHPWSEGLLAALESIRLAGDYTAFDLAYSIRRGLYKRAPS